MSATLTAPQRRAQVSKPPASRWVFENSLSIVLLLAFALLMWAQTFTGWKVYNEENRDQHQPTVGYFSYLTTGHFVEATAENWESEFLQMAAFVWLSVHLRQKGSPESKGLEGEEEVDREPDPTRLGAPWPVRRGGAWLWLYKRSLTWAFLFMFLVSFLLHAAGGAREYSQQQQAHGETAVTMLQFMGTSAFWFQSMQNWQSEFLAIASMVILSIFLRQQGSAESKPVDAAHGENE